MKLRPLIRIGRKEMPIVITGIIVEGKTLEFDKPLVVDSDDAFYIRGHPESLVIGRIEDYEHSIT